MADITGELHRKAYACPICDTPLLHLYVLVTDDGRELVVMNVSDVLSEITRAETHTVDTHTRGIPSSVRRTDTGETHQQYLDRIHRPSGN